MILHDTIRNVRFSYDGSLSRKEEREALRKLADTYHQWNESYRQTGRLPASTHENTREEILQNLPKGIMDPSEAPPFSVELSPEAREILKRNASGDAAMDVVEYSPVTEIRSEHFRWTEVDGIEETETEADGIEETGQRGGTFLCGLIFFC